MMALPRSKYPCAVHTLVPRVAQDMLDDLDGRDPLVLLGPDCAIRLREHWTFVTKTFPHLGSSSSSRSHDAITTCMIGVTAAAVLQIQHGLSGLIDLSGVVAMLPGREAEDGIQIAFLLLLLLRTGNSGRASFRPNFVSLLRLPVLPALPAPIRLLLVLPPRLLHPGPEDLTGGAFVVADAYLQLGVGIHLRPPSIATGGVLRWRSVHIRVSRNGSRDDDGRSSRKS